MNRKHINELLTKIRDYLSYDSYIISESKRNQFNILINNLQDEINKEYEKIEQTLI